jgi:hypothetical protein
MPVTVKKIVLWRTEVDNKPGALASAMAPLAKAGAGLKVMMGYRQPSARGKMAVEVFPVTGRKLAAAAGAAGLTAATIPALLVEGDDKPGLGYGMAEKVSEAGINIAFWMAHAIGGKFAAVIGFETDDDAKHAAPLLKKAAKG